MHGLLSRVRSFWNAVRRRDRLDADMRDEMRLHVEMEAERLARQRGLSPQEARRQARVAFGSVERYTEEGRDARGITGVTGLALDFKLGARMLAKYPGITIVGGLAMALAVGLGAAYLEIVSDFLNPTLPLPDGQRIVGLQNWDQSANRPELRSLHDLASWRARLTTVQQLGAFRTIERNIGPSDALVEPTEGAEITPAAFQMLRVAPLLGRTLADGDDRRGAPAVVVIGYDLWRSRFAGASDVVGRVVRIGNSTCTVAGVMPEGFAFPVNHHFWIPLPSAAPLARQGPAVQIFGRLAPDASMTSAQTELNAIGQQAARDSPATHEHLRPRVVRYPSLFLGPNDDPQAYLVAFAFVALLLLLSSNVATMVFARTATREHEIAMRFALGSTRARIVTQFFVESLVLSLVAAAIGLAGAALVTGWLTRLVWQITGGQAPFWLNSRVNVSTVVYALALAVLGSLVAGVLPAMKATAKHVQARVRHSAGAADSGLRFGGIWSALVVLQVMFAVLVLPPAIVAISALLKADTVDAGFATHEYLSARIELDDSFDDFRAAVEELQRRLGARHDVSRVTLATRLPGMNHPDPGIVLDAGDGRIEIPEEDIVMPSAVSPNYFDAFGARIVAGRAFTDADAITGARVAVVNEAFVAEVLHGQNAVGRRFRYQTRGGQQAATGEPANVTLAAAREPGEWFEIVGVVSNLGMDTSKDVFHSGTGPGLYHPLTAKAMTYGGSFSVRVAFRVAGDPGSVAPQVREMGRAVNPALRLYDVLPLDRPVDRASQTGRVVSRLLTWIAALVAAIALFISAAGIYSVMSFNVSRQAREIGIRIALGATRRRILTGVFSPAMLQMGAGIAAGAMLWAYLIVYKLGPATGGNRHFDLLAASAAALIAIGLLACGVPVRRAFRVEPTQALRHDG